MRKRDKTCAKATPEEPKREQRMVCLMSEEELRKRGEYIWRTINLPNLLENIAPTRSRAHIVLRKGANHLIENVIIRKL